MWFSIFFFLPFKKKNPFKGLLCRNNAHTRAPGPLPYASLRWTGLLFMAYSRIAGAHLTLSHSHFQFSRSDQSCFCLYGQRTFAQKPSIPCSLMWSLQVSDLLMSLLGASRLQMFWCACANVAQEQADTTRGAILLSVQSQAFLWVMWRYKHFQDYHDGGGFRCDFFFFLCVHRR